MQADVRLPNFLAPAVNGYAPASGVVSDTAPSDPKRLTRALSADSFTLPNTITVSCMDISPACYTRPPQQQEMKFSQSTETSGARLPNAPA